MKRIGKRRSELLKHEIIHFIDIRDGVTITSGDEADELLFFVE